MSSKVAVVTGGNKGIGFGIVRLLCKKFSGTVILTARNEELGKAAVEKLKSEGLKPVFHQLDILSNDSIQCIKEYLQKTYGGLDILINNAGIAYKGSSTAPDIEQAEVTIRTNFTASHDVCISLFPLLRPHARVVTVASMTGHLKNLTNSDILKKVTSDTLTENELVDIVTQYISEVKEGTYKENGWPSSKYGFSKLALIALTKIQARQMSKDPREDILVNCCCPGWVRTDMAGEKAPLTIDEGAVTPVHVALLPEGCGLNGEFFRKEAVAVW